MYIHEGSRITAFNKITDCNRIEVNFRSIADYFHYREEFIKEKDNDLLEIDSIRPIFTENIKQSEGVELGLMVGILSNDLRTGEILRELKVIMNKLKDSFRKDFELCFKDLRDMKRPTKYKSPTNDIIRINRRELFKSSECSSGRGSWYETSTRITFEVQNENPLGANLLNAEKKALLNELSYSHSDRSHDDSPPVGGLDENRESISFDYYVTRLINSSFFCDKDLIKVKKLAINGDPHFTHHMFDLNRLPSRQEDELRLILYSLFIGLPKFINFDFFTLLTLVMIINKGIDYSFHDMCDFRRLSYYYKRYSQDINKGLSEVVDLELLNEVIFCYTATHLSNVQFYNVESIVAYFRDILFKEVDLSEEN